MSETYTVKLPQFEGPFDLLLFFIERDELDIHDIPIAKITDDFLKYIQVMERMNIDLASEFILVAATLCRIKAKMLIPRKLLDDQGNEIDPRQELVSRLLEYKSYKSVLEEMRHLEQERWERMQRGGLGTELKKIADKALVDVELENLNLFKLLRTFEKVLERYSYSKPQTVHTIAQFSYSIEDQQERIFLLVSKGRTNFKQIFDFCENRIHAIITFLALLELINAQKIILSSGVGSNNFWLEELSQEEE